MTSMHNNTATGTPGLDFIASTILDEDGHDCPAATARGAGHTYRWVWEAPDTCTLEIIDPTGRLIEIASYDTEDQARAVAAAFEAGQTGDPGRFAAAERTAHAALARA